MVEVFGIDHVYVTVSSLQRSEEFYDLLMPVLGFRKRAGTIGGDPHLHYYNRQFGYSLRPACSGTPEHDPYAPGLHQFCFRVVDEAAVDRAADGLQAVGVEATEPCYYPEYDADVLCNVLRRCRRSEAGNHELIENAVASLCMTGIPQQSFETLRNGRSYLA